jgi:hypothetical protein
LLQVRIRREFCVRPMHARDRATSTSWAGAASVALEPAGR